ncbi:MAG TPA: endo alpha-1,4 polygalactosaminidase [Polyangiaceae bacterium]|nr:endo alpha-1,4 polygalactosaminidase [Polyangiaceae bacterium]
MRRALLVVGLALSAACHGSEGTLVVLHDSADGGSPSSSAGGSGSAGSSGTPAGPYVPAADARWFAQLDGSVDFSQNVELFYVDALNVDAAELVALHDQGKHYLCYLSAGTLESFRDDASEFPDSVIGNALSGYPNERWLDVRSDSVRSLMARRVQALAALGCDGVPPSSLAVHAADTGFDLTLTDALDYARWLAERLHAAGLSAGLTGTAELTQELWPTFDFGLAIGCVAGSGCSEYEPFSQARKTVLHVELGDDKTIPGLCKSAQMLGFEAIVSDRGFTGRCVDCRDIL